MAKYKIGDKVKVRCDLKLDVDYCMCDGTLGVVINREMKNKGGTIVTIKDFDKKGRYCIEEDIWHWTDEMFSELSETTKKYPVSDLKVGDKVRVREDLKEGYSYYSADGYVTESVTNKMMSFVGQIVTIKSCPNSHEYKIEEDNGEWWQTDEMFSEKVVVVATTDINTQEYMIKHQFELPRKYCSIAEKYPHVTWARAVKLYERAVRDVLEEHGVSDIFSGDLGFCRGLRKVDEIFHLYLGFENDVEFAAKELKEDKGSFEKEFTSLWIPSGDCYNCSTKDCGNCTYKDYKLAIT